MHKHLLSSVPKCNIKVLFCFSILFIFHPAASDKYLGILNCKDEIYSKCEMNEICNAKCNFSCYRKKNEPRIWGTEIYSYDSPPCRSAVHDLRISTWDSSKREITIQRIPHFYGYLASVRFGFSSLEHGKLYDAKDGSFRFISPRVKETLLDVVSLHRNFLFKADEKHSQLCLLATNAFSRNLMFDTYIREEIQQTFADDTEAYKTDSTMIFNITWPEKKNFIPSGGFLCLPNNSMLSIITSLAMSSDADFIPQSLTLTVSVNDSVTVEMTEKNGKRNIIWKKDMNVLSSNKFYFNEGIKETRLSIPRVQVGHSGIYSLEREENPSGRALTRLIVRVCPEGKYGENCSLNCSECQNGGICHSIIGDCICPPGFNGTICEETCPPGYIGQACNIPCSSEKNENADACREVLVCLPDPYGCSCAAGFKNLDCNSPCSPGEYGASCRQKRKCYCADNQPCDRFSGLCPRGCREGWHGAGCVTSFPVLKTGPSLNDSTCHSLTLSFREWNPEKDSGEGTAVSYFILYQESTKHEYMKSKPIDLLFLNPDSEHQIVIERLKPETSYNVSVVISQATGEMQMNGLESVIFATKKCSLPGKPSSVKITEKTETSLTVQWEGPDSTNESIISYRVNITDNNTHSLNDNIIFLATSAKNYQHTFNNLSPATTYFISIEASTRDGFGPSLQLKANTKIFVPVIKKPPEFISVSSSEILIKLYPVEDVGSSHSVYFVIVKFSQKPYKVQNRDIFESNNCSSPSEASLYVAAKIEEMPKEGKNFLMGDGTCLNGFYNAPLIKDQQYNIGMVVASVFDGDVKYSDATFMAKPIMISSHVAEEKKGESSMKIVTIILVPLAVICIILLIIVYWKRPKWENFKNRMKIFPVLESLQTSCEASNFVLDHVDPIETESLSEELTHRIAVKDLEGTVRHMLSTGEIRREYMALPRGHSFSCITARIQENKLKNRYGNMLPYDHSRVILTTLPNDPYSNYINANYIDGYGKRQKYIATQGPKPSTINDFWRMVWSEGSCKILMVTNLFESGKTKCEKYWPDNMQIYEDITVQFHDLEQYADFNIKTFMVSKEKEIREVKHFHFLTWPDHGVPTYRTPVVTFLKKVKTYKSDNKAPIIVHCSAGVGRTGAMILLDSMLRMGKAEGFVDPLNQLFNMRQQRSNIVENMDQYIFVYNALVETLCWDTTNISCANLLPEISRLRTPDPKTGVPPVEMQFQRLQLLRQDLRYEELREAHQPENKEKNRSMDILPPERARPILKPAVEENGSNYINAVYVNGYSEKDVFLVTQLPLPHTVNDFWRMLYTTKSKTIILLQDIDFNNESSPRYWPENGTCTYDEFQVQTNTVEEDGDILIHSFTISPLNAKKDQEWNIKMFHFAKWEVGSSLPENKEAILRLIEKSEKWQQRSGKHVITVQCLNGASASGVYCASAVLCDKIKMEKELDVFQTVQCVRTNRPQFIENMAQYNFLYDLAVDYLDAFQIYENFR